MRLTVLNDWHIGAVRSAGTTLATAYQLRLDLLQQFEDTLADIDTDLMILGDLFDGPDISKADLLRTYQILRDWLVRTGKRLYLVNGNHDLSKNSTNFSSFQFLAELLVSEWRGGEQGDWVIHITEGTMTPHGYVIPHVANQDLFNVELSKVPECDHLFVHCNYDNGFAAEKDHSLNLSREQAESLPVRHIVFAHEHQAREELDGKVLVIGNQTPSSVSDCLNNDVKSLLVVHPPTREGNKTRWIQVRRITWQADGDFSEQDWRELVDTGRFIRVVGTATAAEANQVVNTIARFRSTAKALVITNAVRIEGVSDGEEFSLTHEQVTSFNVREALREYLTDEENQKIDKLKEEQYAA
jgi:metallophosphoesterase superfamily enzyme